MDTELCNVTLTDTDTQKIYKSNAKTMKPSTSQDCSSSITLPLAFMKKEKCIGRMNYTVTLAFGRERLLPAPQCLTPK